MNKELKCRAKPSLDKDRIEELKQYMNEYYDGQFVYGNLIKDNWIVGDVVDSEEEWIALEYWIPVIPETVGRFTELLDKNGKEIYEGDIVKDKNGLVDKVVFGKIGYDFEFNGLTGFALSEWKPDDMDFYVLDWGFNFKELEVIGSIHNNPELLEVIKNN